MEAYIVPRSVKKSLFLDIKKALKNYSTDSKLKSVEMVLEAFDSMDARNIRFKLNVDKINIDIYLNFL